MADHFLTKTRISLDQCLQHGDQLALDAYETLHGAIKSRVGNEAAELFAEPLVSRGNDSAQPSVSWYSEVEGKGQPLSRMDSAAQSGIAASLSRMLQQIAPLTQDPEVGGLVAAAMHVRDNDDIWVVAGRPILLNWGMLPEGAATDTASRSAHYAQTLGRFLPLAAAPALSATERAAAAAAAPAVSETASAAAPAAVGAAAKVAAASGQGTTPPPSPPPPRERRNVPAGAWVPLLLLLLLAGGTLIWLLLPGNRIFQERAVTAVSAEEAAALSAEVNASLQERVVSLQTALDGAMCQSDGTLLMPDGVTIEGLLPPDDLDPSDAPGGVQEARAPSILPPAAERVQVAREGGFPDTQSLLAHIEERTAMVLVQGENGVGNGTGFFVGPDLLVTNYHVIEASDGGGIYVTNEAINTLVQAELVKSLGPMDQTGGDFALLRVPGVSQPNFEILASDATLRLQSVIAAGYPRDLMDTDDAFNELRNGNLQAVPSLSVTDGTISAEQRFERVTEVIVHSAPISKGNSGGPLIDMCGRLIGMNTFVKQGPMRNLNFALAGRELVRFLDGTDALPSVVSSVCVPQIERPQAPLVEASTETNEGLADGLVPLNLGGQDQ